MRARLDARAAREGWPALHAELARVDPVTAARLEPTDAQRIQRALEVWEIAGRPLSELQGAREAGDALGPGDRDRADPGRSRRLHAQIAARFDAMLAAGLVDELAGLRARYALTPGLPSMRCVGYRQAWEFLDGHIDAATLRAKGIAATRQLAKRQLTWLRATPATVFEPAMPRARGSGRRVPRSRGPAALLTGALLLCNNGLFATPPAGPSPGAAGQAMQRARSTTSSGTATSSAPRTDGTALLYIDRHLVHEVTSPQAYEGLRLAGRKPWRVGSIVATADHNTPTKDWERGHPRSDLAHAGRDARRQHPRARREGLFPVPRSRARASST